MSMEFGGNDIRLQSQVGAEVSKDWKEAQEDSQNLEGQPKKQGTNYSSKVHLSSQRLAAVKRKGADAKATKEMI